MKLKSKLLALGSALAMAAVSTAADAAVLLQGTGLWGGSTATTAYSKANTSFQFSFSLPNPLDSNPTSSFTNFKYSLDDVSVAGTPDSITFYTVSNLGLFDLAFGSTILSFYGDDIGSTGFLDFPKAYNFTSAVNGNNSAGGLGFLTVTSAVPEPATWAMMVLGFGAMGMAMRRRRRVKTTVSYAQ
ncbi:PEPxxWA-CTERM sorting domain-containing protein [Sphingobium phenoxybenzoativorans]|uniref:PEPxxWA-CTERM sorting domain-containing protein n=1 Tax=Sphingobium phenoxybenzoativorans TaxID=1592790 RepID=UPI000872DFA7|nr:PEPxxWA-CTERM sorting domain-containing protein [Sphingobium phenoxybenzoativorans]